MLDKDDEVSFSDLIEDESQKEPLDNVIQAEKTELESQLVQDIFDSNLLTENQKEKLKLYYLDGLSLAQIGKQFGVTREAIRQNIKNSIGRIQESFA